MREGGREEREERGKREEGRGREEREERRRERGREGGRERGGGESERERAWMFQEYAHDKCACAQKARERQTNTRQRRGREEGRKGWRAGERESNTSEKPPIARRRISGALPACLIMGWQRGRGNATGPASRHYGCIQRGPRCFHTGDD
jgi:hypothetical protein